MSFWSQHNLKRVFRVLITLFLLSSPRLSFAQEEEPFWRSKAKVYEQIIRKRKIVVSVIKVDHEDTKPRYRVVGAGLVNAPISKVRTLMGQFERLPSVSDHFKKVEHDKAQSKLMVHLQAVGFETRLLMKYKWRELPEGVQQMDWEVIDGPFIGMLGHYRLRAIEGRKTEVSTWTLVQEPKVPIPEFLLNFTLEVIAEKVAQKMRSFLETQDVTKEVP
jgi:uncharacterized membrane protein